MQLITVDSVTPRDGTRPWKIHSNGEEYVTWEDGDGELLKSLEGLDVEVTIERRTNTRDGKTYVNKVITEVKGPDTVAPSHRPDEPNVNSAKQVVIIRQNAWSQTQMIYSTAISLLKAREEELTIENIENLVKELIVPMKFTTQDIENHIRRFWFPTSDEEVPF